MINIEDNPCNGCMVNCCKAMNGLLLSKEEFQGLFEKYREGLLIRNSGRAFVLSPKEGRSCPHFDGDGCRIYEDRPIDCRVYPYVISRVLERKSAVKFVFHNRSDCPQKKLLHSSISEAEARALITALARKVYGEDKKIIVQYEKNAALRVLNRLEGIWNRLFI